MEQKNLLETAIKTIEQQESVIIQMLSENRQLKGQLQSIRAKAISAEQKKSGLTPMEVAKIIGRSVTDTRELMSSNTIRSENIGNGDRSHYRTTPAAIDEYLSTSPRVCHADFPDKTRSNRNQDNEERPLLV